MGTDDYDWPISAKPVFVFSHGYASLRRSGIMLVYDRKRFSTHMRRRDVYPGLKEWALGRHYEGVLYLNDQIWIAAFGPPPNPDLYKEGD